MIVRILMAVVICAAVAPAALAQSAPIEDLRIVNVRFCEEMEGEGMGDCYAITFAWKMPMDFAGPMDVIFTVNGFASAGPITGEYFFGGPPDATLSASSDFFCYSIMPGDELVEETWVGAFCDDGEALPAWCYAAEWTTDWETYSSISNNAHLPADQTGPPTVQDLEARSSEPYSVELKWSAPADDFCGFPCMAYDVRCSDGPITESVFAAALELPVHPPSQPGMEEKAYATLPEGIWHVAVRSMDRAGNWSALSNAAVVSVAGTPVVDRAVPLDGSIGMDGNECLGSASWGGGSPLFMALAGIPFAGRRRARGRWLR